MASRTRDWCKSLATYVIEAQWESYWACSDRAGGLGARVAGACGINNENEV